jgi:cytochrome P450
MKFAIPDELDDEFDYLLNDPGEALHVRLHRLRSKTPAAWVRCGGQPAVMFSSFELVDAAFRDETSFPAAAFYEPITSLVLGRNLESMRGAEHTRNRALVSPAFRARLMPGLMAPLLEPVAHELIDRFEADGHADLVQQFTKLYPFRIIMRMLGLPDTAEADVSRWALGMLDIGANFDSALRNAQEFTAYVDPVLQQRRHDPAGDLISTLATEEVDGERLTDEEIFAFLKLLFPAGADTTYLGLGNTIYALLTNPDQLDRVRANLGEESRWAGEEGVRWNSPVALQPRHNPHDVEWHGMAIPGDTPLIFAIVAANRDPAKFDDPDRFDVARRPTGTLTFGLGTHYCLGVHLAKAELDVALRVLLERLPRLRLADGANVEIKGSVVPVLRGPNRLPVRFD